MGKEQPLFEEIVDRTPYSAVAVVILSGVFLFTMGTWAIMNTSRSGNLSVKAWFSGMNLHGSQKGANDAVNAANQAILDAKANAEKAAANAAADVVKDAASQVGDAAKDAAQQQVDGLGNTIRNQLNP